MVAFKLLLSLALVAVALAADVPQIPRATIKLSGPSSGELGTPFVLTCTFNATLPEPEMNVYEWIAEVSFFRGVGSVKTEQVFGTYTNKDSSTMNYHTENLYEGINVFPATNTDKDNGEEMRKEYSVVVLVTKPQMSMGTGYQCAVKLHQNYKHAYAKYTSNAITYPMLREGDQKGDQEKKGESGSDSVIGAIKDKLNERGLSPEKFDVKGLISRARDAVHNVPRNILNNLG